MLTPPPMLVLYTNHGCGWSRRVQIILKELDLEYQEILIDLDEPRPDWFLKLSPLGQVPVLQYNDNIRPSQNQTITDSDKIVWFLHDKFAGTRLLPPWVASSEAATLEFRLELVAFVDLFFSVITPALFETVREPDDARRQAMAQELATMVHDNFNHRLPQSFPLGRFFGESRQLTMAEVLMAPFVQIMYDYPVGNLILPATLPALLDRRSDGRPGRSQFGLWAEVIRKHPSCQHLWDAELRRRRVERRISQMRPQI